MSTQSKIDDLFDYGGADDVENTQGLIKKIEGTELFWYMLSRLIVANTELRDEVRTLERKLEDFEENMSKVFKPKNQYDY
jgi:hypothetical protein